VKGAYRGQCEYGHWVQIAKEFVEEAESIEDLGFYPCPACGSEMVFVEENTEDLRAQASKARWRRESKRRERLYLEKLLERLEKS
jgi:hypothetical protein